MMLIEIIDLVDFLTMVIYYYSKVLANTDYCVQGLPLFSAMAN